MLLNLLIALFLLAAPGNGGEFLKHLRYLSSDELKGRGNNSPQLQKAAEYIAAQFEKYGLQPAGSEGYFQTFEVTTGHDLGSQNAVRMERSGPIVELKLGEDYVPLSYGPEMRLRGPLAFAGFGITAPELNYDDYKEIDVRGKIVLIFEHEPLEQKTGFGPEELTVHATVRSKILNAKHHGATAVVIMPDAYNHPYRKPEALDTDLEVEDMGIHAIRVAEKAGDLLFSQGHRKLTEIHRSIHGHLTPYSFDFEAVALTISLDVMKTRRRIANVVAFLPGQTDEVIIIGAHYDHLGLGDKSSLAPSQVGQIHNGADDNASGTAGLLQLAHDLVNTPRRRGLLFIAFAAEEMGLLGSQYYTEHPTRPLEKTIAMINMDMIGRSQGRLIIGGVGTATEFKTILDKLQEGTPLEFDYAQTPRGASDHLSFSRKKIPVLFFFSGLHSDYHRPSDDWEKVDLERTGQVLNVVRGMVATLDEVEKGPQFVDIGGEHPVAAGLGRGYGPRFGSLPDMAWESGGVRFADIMADTPAAKAGIKPGDILIEFDGKKIDTLYDFTYVLQSKTAGDEVEVVVLRNKEVVKARVRLEARR